MDPAAPNTSNTPNTPNTCNALVAHVPYFGHVAQLQQADPRVVAVRQQAEQQLIAIAALGERQDQRGGSSDWKGLRSDVDRALVFLQQSPSVPLYKLELLKQVLGYVDSLTNRAGSVFNCKPIDKARFAQLNRALYVISRFETKEPHPAQVLLELDVVLAEIQKRSGWYQSELGAALGQAVSREWHPIIVDNRRALQQIGSRLLGLALVELVGRPIVMLYPIYQLLAQVAIFVQSVRVHSVTPATVAGLVKALVLLAVASQLTLIVASYSSVGFSCLTIGCVSIFCSLVDSRVKAVAPVLAPIAGAVDTFLTNVQITEGAIMSAVNSVASRLSPDVAPAVAATAATMSAIPSISSELISAASNKPHAD